MSPRDLHAQLVREAIAAKGGQLHLSVRDTMTLRALTSPADTPVAFVGAPLHVERRKPPAGVIDV